MNDVGSNVLGVLAWNINKPMSSWEVWKKLKSLGYTRSTVKYNLRQLVKDGLLSKSIKRNKRRVKTEYYKLSSAKYICFNGSMMIKKKVGESYTYIVVGCPYASECPYKGTKFELDVNKCRLMRELIKSGLNI